MKGGRGYYTTAADEIERVREREREESELVRDREREERE
jgi:hypothetical protein